MAAGRITMSLNISEAVKRARRLPPRQRQVLRALAGGAERKEIADQLKVSRWTVDSYCAAIFATLGVHNGREAAVVGAKAFRL